MPITQTPAPATSPGAATATPVPAPSPAALYEALNNQKGVLRAQLDELVSQRSDLVTELGNANSNGIIGPGKTGIEDRIAAIDKRIAAVDQEIALADGQVAKAAAIPGAVVPREERPRSSDPDAPFVLGGIFIFVVFLPLSIAFARRLWKRTATVVSAIPADLMARIQRIEQATETSSLEIERIGEGQRFITKLLSDKAPALPAKSQDSRS
jgi:hypothetical protein